MSDDDSKFKGLPEHLDNPFIARLPPPLSRQALYYSLRNPPEFDSKERAYPDHIRNLCLMRLFRYFEPMERHITLAERIDMLIRDGYRSRNLANADFSRHIQNAADAMAGGWRQPGRVLSPGPSGFALLGASGIGKTVSVARALARYPQVIYHDRPISVHQVSWLKVECPRSGGPNQLCINFFGELDRVLGGTNYLDKYGSSARTIGLAMQRMTQLASIHALGALVVDEVEHLTRTRGMNAEDLLNFLVTLNNTIGIPVIDVGTPDAMSVLQGKFRQARRATGIGSLVWDRMPQDKAWNRFIEELWKYQWTREFTPLNDELRDVLYAESQGIVDVVVKLFVLAQMKAIRLSGPRRQREILEPALFRQVVADEFQMIRPMLDACRSNDRAALGRFDDLLPFREHVASLFGAAIGGAPSVMPSRSEIDGAGEAREEVGDSSDLVRSTLKNLGLADDVAELLLNEAKTKCPSGDPLQLVATVNELLKASGTTARKVARPRRIARRSGHDGDPKALDSGDLRRIVSEGSQRGLTGYDALKAAGVIKALDRVA